MTRPPRAALLGGCLALVLAPGVASGCWIDDSVWESRVADADLLGVVECVTAGVDVARYRLVESWGGEVEVGEELTAGLGGLHLVGDRFLVVSPRSAPAPFPAQEVDYRAAISTWGPLTPLGGRAVRTDRRLRFEAVRLPLRDGDQPLERVRSPHRTLAELEAAARELLALPEPARELRVLKALARRHLSGRRDLLERVLAVESPERLARLLIYERGPDASILGEGGRAATLAVLESTPGQVRLIAQIRTRLGLPVPPREVAEAADPREVALARLARLEASLGDEWPRRAPARRCDPGALAATIASGTWEDPYWLASTFALVCPDDRAHHLRTLLAAREPWVQVTGAVYLALETETSVEAEGVRALERLTRLEGDPGAWAALTLARRGDVTVVLRLLRAFGSAPDDSGAQAQLREQAQALLSNAAAQAGVAQPPRLSEWGSETERAYRTWWIGAGELRLHDPWLPELRAQRID